jgi:2-oxoglutarate ferredoxin oxidoreductase subunit alpha
VEEASMRIAQMEKRMRKHDLMAKDIRDPLLEGPENADLTLVGWGSTYGPIHEARVLLEGAGMSVNHLHYHEVWPLPVARTEQVLKNARRAVCIENNFTGQLALIIRMVTGIHIEKQLLKYDGRPFTGDEIAQKVREEVLANV